MIVRIMHAVMNSKRNECGELRLSLSAYLPRGKGKK